MNLIQTADLLKSLPDQALQKEMLNPSGTAPSYLVLSELQRRKDMRSAYQAQQQKPQSSMAEEMSQPGATMPQPPVQPPQGMNPAPPQPMPQGMARGGGVSDAAQDKELIRRAVAMHDKQLHGGEHTSLKGLADGGAVDEVPWYLRPMRPPSSRPNWPRVPAWARPIPNEPEDTPQMQSPIPRQIPGRPYPSMPQGYPDPWAPQPGQSVGQSIANRLQGISPQNIPSGAGETGGQPYIPPSRESFSQGYGGPDPIGMEPVGGGQGWNGPDPVGIAAVGAANEPVTERGVGIPPRGIREVGGPAVPRDRGSDVGGGGGRGVTDRDMRITRRIESGSEEGNYKAVGPVANKAGNRAYGAYGVMDFNIGPWTKEAIGKSLTTEEFLNDKDAQDAVFKHRFGQYKAKYGSSGAAGRAWFAGEGGMNDPSNPADVNGMTTSRYGRMYDGEDTSDDAKGGRRNTVNVGGDDLTAYYEQYRRMMPKDNYDQIEARLAGERAENEKGTNQDKALAILSTGLGIMAGESPNAATNIGRGAMAGVAQWNSAQREMRQAARDIRNAENQLAIARANRDERGVENAMKLHALASDRGEKAADRRLRLEEMSQRTEIARDEQESRAADRTENRAIRKEAANERAQDRRDAMEIRELDSISREIKGYEDQITKYKLDITANPEQAEAYKDRINIIQGKINERYEYLGGLRDRRDIAEGRIPQIDPNKKGYTADGKQLRSGQKFVDPNGIVRTWRGDK